MPQVKNLYENEWEDKWWPRPLPAEPVAGKPAKSSFCPLLLLRSACIEHRKVDVRTGPLPPGQRGGVCGLVRRGQNGRLQAGGRQTVMGGGLLGALRIRRWRRSVFDGIRRFGLWFWFWRQRVRLGFRLRLIALHQRHINHAWRRLWQVTRRDQGEKRDQPGIDAQRCQDRPAPLHRLP